jgi:hypothetical protein
MRHGSFLLLAALLALGCPACVSLPLRSFWARSEPPADGLGGDWPQSDESLGEGVRVKALNTGKDLYLTLSTDTPAVQAQLSGRYGQALTFWFGTRPEGHGLCLTFTPVPEGHQSVGWDGKVSDAMDHSVMLEGPRAEGLPRPWEEGSEGLALSYRRSVGTLTYVLKVPLQPETKGGFALGLEPGDSLLISIDASDLGPPDAPVDTADTATENPGVAGLNIPSLGAGLSPLGLSGAATHGRRRGGGARPPALRPDQPFWYQLKLNLAREPLARP